MMKVGSRLSVLVRWLPDWMTLSRFPYNPFLGFYAESCSSWLEGPARHGGDAADDEYILPMQVKTEFHYFFHYRACSWICLFFWLIDLCPFWYIHSFYVYFLGVIVSNLQCLHIVFEDAGIYRVYAVCSVSLT